MLVFDSSTLILLAKADLLDLFLDSFGRDVVIPRAVERECVGRRSRPDELLIRTRIGERRIGVEAISSRRRVARISNDFHLGQGEAEAIVLALEKRAALLATDDRKAIQACKALHLDFTTAIAILVRLREKGAIEGEQAEASLERLGAFGRYSRSILEDARKRLEGRRRNG